MTALRIEGLTAGYGQLTVLREFGLQLTAGELVVLAGPNGAGKSTLLGSLAGTVRAGRGSIALDGAELRGRTVRERVRAGIGIVPEGRGLFPSLTVADNLRVAARAARLPAAERRAGTEAAVAAFPLIGERMGERVATLSGGQQQMVAIGRALLTRPRVLLLDEPSMGLAPVVWKEVLATCRTLADDGRIVLLAEQRVMQALDTADRCVVLQRGQVLRDALADEIRGDPDLARSYFTNSGGRGMR